jgi:hypothetical protein
VSSFIFFNSRSVLATNCSRCGRPCAGRGGRPPSGSGRRVDDAQLQQVLLRELQALRELRASLVALEQDRAARLGADHAVPGELHHRDAVGDADAQRPPRPALAVTMLTIGVRRRLISIRFSAMLSAWPRSSAPMPG